MAPVRVKFFATIRKLTGTNETSVDAASIHELLSKLEGEYGSEFISEILDENGEMKLAVKILVNGLNIVHLQEFDTPLSFNDVVAIFPPVGGG